MTDAVILKKVWLLLKKGLSGDLLISKAMKLSHCSTIMRVNFTMVLLV